MKIFFCKNLWWPFGSHLTHTMYRKIYCDMHDYKLLYIHNKHPAYSLYSGNIRKYYPRLNEVNDEDIIKYIEEKYKDAGPIVHYILEFDDQKKLINELKIDYNKDILTQNWDTFFPSKYSDIQSYHSDIIKKISEPSDEIKKYLNDLPFIQDVEKLNRDYIGMHIRWTDKINGWCTETEFYDVDVYFKYAINLREESGVNNIVLNCDNVEALQKIIEYNDLNNLKFNIIYDKQESLPANEWRECIFQKWALGDKDLDNNKLIKDLLNGFKIYKTLYEAKYMIGNLASNMYLIPYIARNCNKDINISLKPPYALSRKFRFSKEINDKRIEGDKLYKKLIKL